MVDELEEFYEFRDYEELTKYYRGKNPKWGMLPKSLLNDPVFMGLSFTERGVYVSLFLLALRHENRIPCKVSYICHTLCAHRGHTLQRALNKFEDLGIFLRKVAARKEKKGINMNSRTKYVGSKKNFEARKKKELERFVKHLAKLKSI